jgi:hypothetical protein
MSASAQPPTSSRPSTVAAVRGRTLTRALR